MQEVFEILKYTLPSLILFLTVFILFRMFLKNEEKSRRARVSMKNYKFITPVKLQAYERAVLRLERVPPESLLLRVNRPGMTTRQLQQELTTTVRAEFEHNLSQQIYMSPQAWEMVKSARSNLIKLINSSAENIEPDAPSFNLSKTILETVMSMNAHPTAQALDFIKKEAGTYLV
jgi:hypothetical protein